MKPVACCKICGNARPGECVQTLFGLNVETKDNAVIIHGDLKSKKEVK